MRPIHRDDGELCGFVAADGAAWQALAVFGGVLDVAASADAAERVVREVGLAALAERWLLGRGEDEEVVCIQEASPAGVTVALGYYSMPGVETLRITRDELERGDVRLRRSA